jgi:hypothetical protein
LRAVLRAEKKVVWRVAWTVERMVEWKGDMLVALKVEKMVPWWVVEKVA